MRFKLKPWLKKSAAKVRSFFPASDTQIHKSVEKNAGSAMKSDNLNAAPKHDGKRPETRKINVDRKIYRKIKWMRRKSYLTSLIISQERFKRATVMEKVVKSIIYVSLRIVIPNSKWKDPKKNYLLIDRAFEKIMSSDFIYIPSSLAFYIIMAFMPIVSVIIFLNNLDFMKPLLEINGQNALSVILGDFVPGFSGLLEQINFVTSGSSGSAAEIGAYASIVASLVVAVWISSGGFAKLVYTQSHLYNHKFVGGYWMNRLKGMSMVLALTLYLIIVLAINIAVVRTIEQSSELNRDGKTSLRYIFLFISLFFAVLGGMCLLFRYSPRFKTRLRWIIPGAMTTTLPTTFFLVLFGSITSLWSYSRYGALGSIMYIAMSSLLVSYFLFVGITVNSAYHHAFVGQVEKKWTISKK